jgi:hypothetical protein
MAANPLTDQILAKLDDTRGALNGAAPTPQAFLDTFDLFAARIVGGIPGTDPAVIGEVLLHAGELYSSFATNGGTSRITTEALAAVRILTEAGQRLYTPGGLR